MNVLVSAHDCSLCSKRWSYPAKPVEPCRMLSVRGKEAASVPFQKGVVCIALGQLNPKSGPIEQCYVSSDQENRYG